MIFNFLVIIAVSFLIHVCLLGLTLAIAQHKLQKLKMVFSSLILASIPAIVYLVLVSMNTFLGIDTSIYLKQNYLRFITTTIRVILYVLLPIVLLKHSIKESFFIGICWFFLAFLGETIVDQIY